MRNQASHTLKNKSIYIELSSYMIPGIAGLLFNSMYIVVDGIFVARLLGREALAAVTVGVPVVEILLAFSMLMSVGAGVLISNKNGQGKHEEARYIFNLSVRLLLIVSLFTAVASILFLRPIALALGATADIVDLVITYLKVFFIFSPTFMFSYAICSWLRNDSKPKLVMIAQIIGALANVFLDWLFMGPLQMGIAGASLATGLGPLLSISIMLPHFILKKGNLYLEKTKMKIEVIKDIVLKGIPSFTMESALGITTFCVNIAISVHLGALGFAAFGILGYIALIVLSVFLGMAEGSQPLISFYHGANQRRITKKMLIISLQIAGFIGVLTYILLYKFANIPVSIFADHDAKLAQTAITASRYYFLALFASGLNIILASYVQSIGKWQKSVIISLSRSLFLLVPLLLILPNILGAKGIWLSVPLAELLTVPIAYVLLSNKG